MLAYGVEETKTRMVGLDGLVGGYERLRFAIRFATLKAQAEKLKAPITRTAWAASEPVTDRLCVLGGPTCCVLFLCRHLR